MGCIFWHTGQINSRKIHQLWVSCLAVLETGSRERERERVERVDRRETIISKRRRRRRKRRQIQNKKMEMKKNMMKISPIPYYLCLLGSFFFQKISPFLFGGGHCLIPFWSLVLVSRLLFFGPQKGKFLSFSPGKKTIWGHVFFCRLLLM